MHEALDIRRSGRLPGSLVAFLGACLLVIPGHLEGQNLRGSPASLDRQNAQARAHNYSYLQTGAQVREFVASGYLVRVHGNADFDLHLVSYPYVRPAVRVFIERLASQYRSACGEKLVVTSLTRPISEQPANASSRSVHPTGMAVDLRRSGNARCRSWLESTLLSLESQGVLEAIYETNPPHYHLALYPDPYMDYLARAGAPTSTGVVAVRAEVETPNARASLTGGVHSVARGENLSTIAARYGVTLSQLRAENGLRSDRILVGQRLQIPGSGSAPAQSVAVAANLPPADATRTSSTPVAAPTTRTHTIARGESLWQIAQRYGVSEAAIRAANGIAGSRILAGNRLQIPVGGASGEVLHYTVRSGDSLWTIASRLGTTVEEIRASNGMDTTRIYAGQVLAVPLSR